MDVLAQRKDSGRIEGSIMINGRPQGISFQRTTGYCEQNDVHEGTATVRESLLFSARLRQSFETPDDQKVAYVEKIMGLLELTPIQHAVVGSEFPLQSSYFKLTIFFSSWFGIINRATQAFDLGNRTCSQTITNVFGRTYLWSRRSISLQYCAIHAKACAIRTDCHRE
jgi:hypothetical protein